MLSDHARNDTKIAEESEEYDDQIKSDMQHLCVYDQCNDQTEPHRNSNISNTRTITVSDNEIDTQFHPNMNQTTEELDEQELDEEYTFESGDEQIQDISFLNPVLQNNQTFIVKDGDDTHIQTLKPDRTHRSHLKEAIEMGYNSQNIPNNSDMKYDIEMDLTQQIEADDFKLREENTIISPNIGSEASKYDLIINDAELALPYEDNCFYKTKYKIKTFFITNPRIYALYLLFVQTWPRILLIFDMYTDVVVAYELYRGKQPIWFMLSSLFVVLPFILVWSASLRFIQLYVQRLFDKLNTDTYRSSNDKNKKSSLIHTLINIFLMIYMFPLIGALFMAAAEIFWIIADVLRGIKSFIFGTGLIETENREIKAMKSYRRAVEVFSESVPQSMLQFYIFVRLGILEQTNENASYQGVSANALYLSFGVSMVNLCYNFYKFKKEAQLHGVSWSEYSLSVLQLAEIPTIKLVPRTPAIKKGYIEEANFAAFNFDKQSITPLLDAINSSKCKLKTIKIAVGSLSKLDAHSCKYLGNLLYNTGVKVLFSRCSSLLDLKILFQRIDSGHKGYITLPEFRTALNTLHCSTESDPESIFRVLAVRRLRQRDRIYWYDFFKIAASVKKRKPWQVFDLTEIEHPVYFIFQQIQECVQKNEQETTEVINRFTNLYHFCDGLRTFHKINDTTNNHIFYAVVDVLALLDKTEKPYPNYERFIAKTFNKLLTSNVFDHTFYLQRNTAFSRATEQPLNSCNWVQELMKNKKNGCNIFEYCFLFDTEYRHFQCKIFARLLDVWLSKSHANEVEKSISKNGELSDLFVGTNGFLLMDYDGKTPLYYAVKHKLESVVNFYGKYVFNNTNCLSEYINMEVSSNSLHIQSSTDSNHAILNQSLHYNALISNTDNSCFGFKHVSPKDAAHVWLIVELLFNIIQCFMWTYLGWNGYIDKFVLELFPNITFIDYVYKIAAVMWIFFSLINLLAMYAMHKKVKPLICLQLIAFIIGLAVTCLSVGAFLYFQERTKKIIALSLTFLVFKILFTFFGFCDVYKIVRLMNKSVSSNNSQMHKQTKLTEISYESYRFRQSRNQCESRDFNADNILMGEHHAYDIDPYDL